MTGPPLAPPAVVVRPRRPTLSHRVEYAALRGTFAALGLLGWRRASAFGARLGRFGYRPLGVRRGVVESQVAAAFPGLPPDEVRRVAREAYEQLGRTAVEAALLARIGRQGVLDMFEGAEGWELIESAMAGGRGAILVAGHYSNWELAGAYVASRGVPLDVIVRGMSNSLFEGYLNETRARLGMTVVHDREAVRRTSRSLREGRAVAFLSDQGVIGLASTFVPFFGRPAKTPRGPAVFALRLGVPTLFVIPVRQASGRYRLHVERVPVEDTGDRDRDVDAVVAAYTRILERFVRRDPGQYFWHHRRWRRQPKGTPAELSEPG